MRPFVYACPAHTSNTPYTALVSSSVHFIVDCVPEVESRCERISAIAIDARAAWRFAWRRKKVKLGQVQRASQL